ncbi:DNA-binding transcriptional LysR family regulator [Cytobacillus oceanisediminis]|jgi:DNA-binding transcriptional LysR family regulator|uniref:DNA-binding transcriptional LysR family regulator n=1 Tax=Cytobacillus oceanisediminis TaxID=665099 RepID=A0A2V3A3R4_9BACI|nr:LysR family transcriptional regulator [Cytobacillus oceanisediminis]PWW31361.1 DNA-binding transcriptional LysR family regulator [Cytobacillus oceanisediminis]
MELTDLKVFMAIIDEGNITRAAEKLGYVQSNITMRVRKMESELGAQLFQRNPKGVIPTEKGLVLSNYASDILLRMDEAIRAVKEPDYPCGPLVIGVVETVASSGPFIRALSKFQSKYPEVALSLITGTSPVNYEKVLNRQLDGAFFTGEFDLSQLQVAYEIREEVVLLTAADGNEPAIFPDVENTAWVVFSKGCPLRATIEDWLHSVSATPTNIVEISTLETMLNCVRAGIGYTLLTKSAVAVNDDRVQAHPVPEQYKFTTTRLVSRKAQFHSKTFAAFAECVRETGI